MNVVSIGTQFQKLFQNDGAVAIAAIGSLLYGFLFPEVAYLYGALAVFGIMLLDLGTKIYALGKCSGSLGKAFKAKIINSRAFFKGTLDKLVIFAVMLIVCGCAYRLAIIADIAVWFTQLVFTLMFLRDLLSILENLTYAGIDVGIFKRAVKKKMCEYVNENENEEEDKNG